MSILTDAEEIIHGERVKSYGPATDTFQKAAWILTQLTGKEFTAEDVAKVQIVMKLIRNQYSPDNTDHLKDVAGYIGILSDLQTKADYHE